MRARRAPAAPRAARARRRPAPSTGSRGTARSGSSRAPRPRPRCRPACAACRCSASRRRARARAARAPRARSGLRSARASRRAWIRCAIEAPHALRIALEGPDRRDLERIDAPPRSRSRSGSPGSRSRSRSRPRSGRRTAGARGRERLAARRTRGDSRLALVEGFSFSTDVTRPLRGDGRAGHRPPRVVRRLARGRARRVPGQVRGRVQRAPRSRDRGADDRGAASATTAPPTSTRRSASGRGASTCAARASPTSTGSSGTASSSPTATRGTRPSIARRIARLAFPDWLIEAVATAGGAYGAGVVGVGEGSFASPAGGFSFAPGLAAFGSGAFVPMRTIRVSPLYEVVHVSVSMSVAVRAVDLARRRRPRGARALLPR